LRREVKPVILKLGGSVITKKDKPLTPNKPAIKRLVKEISKANIEKLVVVHGGGSFGHPLAKKYDLDKGFRNSAQLIGFSKTCHAMSMLNDLVTEALISCGVPAVAVCPSSFIVTKHGRIEKVNWNVVTKLLETGFIPVLYGDVVLDSSLGFTILSGDQLVAELAIKLDAERIVVGVDVDGLYTSDPKTDSSAKLIRKINLKEVNKIQHLIESSKVTDVTGGMVGKISELKKAAEQGIPVLILNALKPNKIYKALRNERVVGTLISR